MKKRILLLFLVLLSVFMVASCNNGNNSGNGGGNNDGDSFWDKDGNGTPDWQEEEVTITYASWQYNNPDAVTIESLMVQEFTKKYPNIKVEMQIVGESSEWDEQILALQEAGNLPDVFLVNRMENFLPYEILADITEMWDNDPDTEFIFDSVRDLGLHNDKRYVVPTYIYPQFWVVNLDLLRAANVAIPGYDWTWEQMENIAKSVKNDTTHVIGIYGTAQYFYEYAKVLDPEAHPYAYGYDGEKFNFSTEAYLTAMNSLEIGLSEGYIVNSLSAEQCLEYYGDATADPRYIGKVGIWREASWSVKEYIPNFNFNFDIYPAPSGVGMGNTDIAGVSSLSEHPEAAYQLLKWMSYSEEGILRRFELYDEYQDELYISGNNYPYPIVDYGIDGQGNNKIWDAIPYGSTAPGLVDPLFTEALRNAATQANKEVIGWDAVDEAVGPYFSQILMGEADFLTLRSEIQADADRALARKRAELE